MSGVPAARFSSMLRLNAWWILAGLVLMGAYLRFANLGGLAFRWDEDLSSLAVKGILAHGIPQLPSGMIYLRGAPFLYAMAASVKLFGFNEWAMRLPAVLFGIGMIPIAFLFGKRLFGGVVGLVVAALVTLCVWDIELARYARMYTPFEFFYLLTLLCIWRYRVLEESTLGGVLCIVLALVGLSLHDLGYTLALAFFIPLLIEGRRVLGEPRRFIIPIVAFCILAAFFFSWGQIRGHYYFLPAINAAPADVANVPSSNGGIVAGLLELVALVAARLETPTLPIFSAAWGTVPLVVAALVGGPLVATGLFWRRQRAACGRAAVALLLVVALSCGFQLFNVALLGILALAFTKSEGVSAFRRVDVRFAMALTAVSFVVWLAVAVGLHPASGGTADGGVLGTLKASLRDMLDYPRFFVFWGFPRAYPLTTIPALIGGLWAFDRAARNSRYRAERFLIAAFAVPMIANGVSASGYEYFRYDVPFEPLYFTFVALGLTRWRDVLSVWRRREVLFGKTAQTLTTVSLAALVLALDVNPARAWLAAQGGYANDGGLYRLFSFRRFNGDDLRSAAKYVMRHARPGDEFLTFDCREYFNYLGKLDHCIVSRTYLKADNVMVEAYKDGDTFRDLYLGTPIIMSVDQLKRTLTEAPSRTKWLLASDGLITVPGRVSEDMRRFIQGSAAHVVYVAPDGRTRVYRFGAGAVTARGVTGAR